MKSINNYILEKFKISKDINIKSHKRSESFLDKFYPGSKCLCIITNPGEEASNSNYLEVIEIINLIQENGLWNKANIKFLTNIHNDKGKEIRARGFHSNDDFLVFIYDSKIYHIICEYDSLEEFYKLETNRKFYYDEYQPGADHDLFKLGLMKDKDYDIIEEELTK